MAQEPPLGPHGADVPDLDLLCIFEAAAAAAALAAAEGFAGAPLGATAAGLLGGPTAFVAIARPVTEDPPMCEFAGVGT